jgi:hypothetical protein
VSDAIAWLAVNLPSAPPALQEHLERAVVAGAAAASGGVGGAGVNDDSPLREVAAGAGGEMRGGPAAVTGSSSGVSVAEALACGARLLYREVLAGTGGREDAIVLLAADALLTHAFEAQAESDPAGLAAFAARWGASGEIGRLADFGPGSGEMNGEERGERGEELVEALESLRALSKQQAALYRLLAGYAEDAGNPELAQRFHDLHADEQHHFSRLTARVLELGAKPGRIDEDRLAGGALGEIERSGIPFGVGIFAGWEELVRRLEEREMGDFRSFPLEKADGKTRVLIEEIIAVEAHQFAELGGKWTKA